MLLSNEDFKYKIVNASPTRLVIVTFELILDRIKRAKISLDTGNFEDFRYNISNSRQFLNELICSLDMNSQVSLEMADLYIYVSRLLVAALFKKDVKYLDTSEYIIVKLKDGLIKEVDDSLGDTAKNPAISDTYMKLR